MPSIALSLLRDDDAAGALQPGESVWLHSNDGAWRAVLLESGMASGEPSVALIIPIPGEHGDSAVAVLETSLLVLHTAARGLVAMAETQLGWTMPA